MQEGAGAETKETERVVTFREKAVATHSSTLAWTEEPGRLLFMRSLRVRHD